MTTLTDNGQIVEMTASGVLRLDKQQTMEAFQLLDHVRAGGRGGVDVVARWLAASGQRRELERVLAPELAKRGFVLDCALCRAGVPAGKFTSVKARRRFGVAASWVELREHRHHAARRPVQPRSTKRKGLPAPGSVRDGDERQGELD